MDQKGWELTQMADIIFSDAVNAHKRSLSLPDVEREQHIQDSLQKLSEDYFELISLSSQSEWFHKRLDRIRKQREHIETNLLLSLTNHKKSFHITRKEVNDKLSHSIKLAREVNIHPIQIYKTYTKQGWHPTLVASTIAKS